MKYATALIAAAVGAQAWSSKNGTQVVTEVVDQYVTYCPGPTHITHGDKVYTVTKPTTLTITNCPCTITRPVVSTSAVVCHTCTAAPSNPAATEPAATEPAHRARRYCPCPYRWSRHDSHQGPAHHRPYCRCWQGRRPLWRWSGRYCRSGCFRPVNQPTWMSAFATRVSYPRLGSF